MLVMVFMLLGLVLELNSYMAVCLYVICVWGYIIMCKVARDLRPASEFKVCYGSVWFT